MEKLIHVLKSMKRYNHKNKNIISFYVTDSYYSLAYRYS